MLKKVLCSIAITSSVLLFCEDAQSKQLHALPNYYDDHGTSEDNYKNSVFCKPINSCRFFASQLRFNGTNFEVVNETSPLLSLAQYKDLYEEVTFSPITISSKAEQFKNASLPTLVTLSGITTDFRLAQLAKT